MSPTPLSPLTVLTSLETTTPATVFTLPTIIALVLLALLTMFLLGALLAFAFRHRHRQPGAPSGTERCDDTFLDLEAGGKKSPFFEVVDTGARSSPSVWTGFTGSRPRITEPEQTWPVHTVSRQSCSKAPSHRQLLKALTFWRVENKRESSTLDDLLRTKELLDVESQAHARSWPQTWRRFLSLFRRELPPIVIHPCDGSPAFLYAEDLDSTPALQRARSLLGRCEAIAFSPVDYDFEVASSESHPAAQSSFMVLSDSSGFSSEEGDAPHFEALVRPSTPLGMAPADEPARSFVGVSISDATDLRTYRAPSTYRPILVGVPKVDLGFDVVPSFTIDPVATSSALSSNIVLEDDTSAPSNSSSESSVTDIISILEDISTESFESSDSLSLKTSFSDDSMALPPSRKGFSRASHRTTKRVSLQSSDLDLDLSAEEAFSRSTYYGVLGEYHVRRVRDSVAAGDTL
ncbi:hypothetical protein OH76DRAFT_697077 [Lentinus brumalis]|uniref:Uncharacterized protein n=1 Tax=Lentinus brumalis TaxID=2498619 RepID=A0A371D698_9APHY|nr:hypothetical protein OH76DRAFT_697077 [Polyporus brumalis]